MDTEAAVSPITARVLRLYKKPHEIILNGIAGDQHSRHYVELTLSSTWDYLQMTISLSNAMLWTPYCLPLSAQMPTEFEA